MQSGALAQHANHFLMPAMHAVEGADGQHTTTMSRAQVVQAPNQLHRGRKLRIILRNAPIIERLRLLRRPQSGP